MAFRLLISGKAQNHNAPRTTKEAGFSLLEILAVLVIIGLMSAAVVLSMRAPESPESSFRDALIVSLNQSAKDSIYTGRVNALSVSEAGLQLMSYADRNWTITRDFPFDRSVSMRLRLDGDTVELPEEATPMIMFEPTGDITDFQLTLRGFGEDINIFNGDDGSVQLGVRR